jgi:hypothetical protein
VQLSKRLFPQTWVCICDQWHAPHKNTETKNTWARDDPAILLLIAACLFGAFDFSVMGHDLIKHVSLASCRYSLVDGIFVFSLGSYSVSCSYDNTRLSACRNGGSHNTMVCQIPLNVSSSLSNYHFSGSSRIGFSSRHHLIQHQPTPRWNGRMLSMCIQTRSSLST